MDVSEIARPPFTREFEERFNDSHYGADQITMQEFGIWVDLDANTSAMQKLQKPEKSAPIPPTYHVSRCYFVPSNTMLRLSRIPSTRICCHNDNANAVDMLKPGNATDSSYRIDQCFLSSSSTSLMYLTNVFLCTRPANCPSLNTHIYRNPSFTKH